jgi:hypothetical protein
LSFDVGGTVCVLPSNLLTAITIDLAARPLANEFTSILFLFARFWATVEVFRHEGMSVATSKDKRGKRLNAFLDCLESRRVRVVDRITQRAVGEVMIDGHDSAISFIKFVHAFEQDEQMRRWLEPLALVLSRTSHTFERQKILQYGTILHAMIDSLDPKHLVTRKRPGYSNKLTKKTWRALHYRVFGQYLLFVQPAKYLGKPRWNAKKATAGL